MIVKRNHVSYLSCMIDIAGYLCHQIRQGVSGFIVNHSSSDAGLWLKMWLKVHLVAEMWLNFL
jgi:hypothetical protein